MTTRLIGARGSSTSGCRWCPISKRGAGREPAGPRRRPREPGRARRPAGGDPGTPRSRAARILTERLAIERSSGGPIEPRGVVSEHDARTGLLRVWSSTQAPLPIKNGLARIFGLPEFKVEVIAPDTGGGFGTKTNGSFSSRLRSGPRPRA